MKLLPRLGAVSSKLDLSVLPVFLDGTYQRAWLNIGPYALYVRKAHHMVDGRIVKTFDLANAINRGHMYGGFWEIYAAMCSQAKARNIQYLYLESILNERLLHAYLARGCVHIQGSNPPCAYRKLF